tara:strand:+ start:8374 stop:9219 length:846 start_codon:yes stop_codon:yes gene_type:complete
MTIYVYENFHQNFSKQDRYTRAFAKWSKGVIIKTQSFARTRALPRDTTAVAFFGIKGKNFTLYKHCVKNKIPFYYMDHAYVNPFSKSKPYEFPFWFRIVKNGFLQNNMLPGDEKRYNENFDFRLEPYENYKNKNMILVVPPSNIVAELFNIDPIKWLNNTIDEIKFRCPDKEILLRYKYKGNQKPFRHDEPIDTFFDKTYCLVTHSSNISFKTLIKGIPVISSDLSATRFVSNKFEDINNLVEFDRKPLLHSVLSGQFKLDEIKNNAISFKTFNEIKQVVK